MLAIALGILCALGSNAAGMYSGAVAESVQVLLAIVWILLFGVFGVFVAIARFALRVTRWNENPYFSEVWREDEGTMFGCLRAWYLGIDCEGELKP